MFHLNFIWSYIWASLQSPCFTAGRAVLQFLLCWESWKEMWDREQKKSEDKFPASCPGSDIRCCWAVSLPDPFWWLKNTKASQSCIRRVLLCLSYLWDSAAYCSIYGYGQLSKVHKLYNVGKWRDFVEFPNNQCLKRSKDWKSGCVVCSLQSESFLAPCNIIHRGAFWALMVISECYQHLCVSVTYPISKVRHPGCNPKCNRR